MAKKTVVLDASIVVKWFLIEPLSEHALRIRDDYIRGEIDIAAPELLLYEVLNALRYSRVYTMNELVQIGASLNKYGFKLYPLRSRLKENTIKIAIRNNITIYDASYIALAEHLGVKLYTTDGELLRKFPKVALSPEEYKES